MCTAKNDHNLVIGRYETVLALGAQRGHSRINHEDSLLDLVGKLLIALPSLTDPRFHRSVILMCDYSQDGAMGVMLNKPASQTSLSDLLRQLQIDMFEGFHDELTYFGGPVEMGRGFVLHDDTWIPKTDPAQITSEAYLTTTQDVLKAIARGRGPDRFKVALGYSGWSDGQLEDEIKENAWIVADADARLLFEVEAADLWSEALASLGVSVQSLASDAGRA